MGVADPGDFEDWYRDQHPRLASAILTLSRDPDLSADVADEAFSRALERWPRVSEMASPEGWVYRTAVNLLHRKRRRRQVERRLLRHSTMASPASDPGWDPDLLAAIAGLPERQRLAVALHYIADLSVDDTAEAMGVQPGTVMATVHAARANLHKTLAPTAEEPTP